jgi:hypothetical protein
MLVEQIDRIDLEPLERFFCNLLNVLWPTVESAPLASVARIRFPPELGCDDDIAAKWSESFTDKFLVQERPVDFSGVEECDTPLDRGAEKRRHLPFVLGRSVGPTHAHASKSNG